MPRYFSERGNSHIEVIEKIHKKYGDRAKIQIQRTVPATGIMGLFGKVQYEYRGYLRTGEETREIQKSKDNEARAAILAVTGKDSIRSDEFVSKNKETTSLEDEKIGEVLQELKHLKDCLMLSASTPPPQTFPILSELSDILDKNDFEEDYISKLLESIKNTCNIADLDNRGYIHQLTASYIAKNVHFFRNDVDVKPRVVALVGPTGVGKTTTIAKLAAVHGLGDGSDVRIITVDNFRIGARAQIETYGKIMGIPVQIVDNSDELRKQIVLASDSNLILIDTIGKNPRDKEKFREMRKLLSVCGENTEIHLVLSATTKASDLRIIMEQFRLFNYWSIIITKLDETNHIGNILCALISTTVPISYLTDGQNVPVDIAIASPIRLLSKLKGLEFDKTVFAEQHPAPDLTAIWR
ncbi:Flagellar biosynthesis protein FlhF [Olavius algarvensis spirochete endosymbiont]|uniref:flagellar biosynthesis protein FlhF n=1 Tax=Olavius algarvensis spirochete endosymbiont TaxID=260710 RepID=UPI000F0EF176|nr:flagellar biosynthesis protein FlhF [Olavius algarvensis spirochete endosymbiont]VDA99359.1 Flagellar biosynthesis protein FlhF [Olavius algarvensis spirochete endosymbiont]